VKEKLSALLENRVFDNFFELVACRALGRRTGLTVYRLGEKRILVDHEAGDQSGTKKCLVSGMYRDLLEQIELPERPNIIDLGGNGGGFTLLCELEFGPLGQVLSVEFNPDTYRRLWFNLKSNVSHEIEVLNAAVAGEDGIRVVADRKGSTSDRPENTDADSGGVEIEAITLDSLIERYFEGVEIDLCKMDIEGAEYESLLSPRASKLDRIRNLIIEIHPSREYAAAQLEERLAQAGFELKAQTRAAEEDGDVRLYCRQS
jgi:FkbM family methyltransferase